MTEAIRDPGTTTTGILGRGSKTNVTKRGGIYCPGGIVGTEMSWAAGGNVTDAIELTARTDRRWITIADLVQWGNTTHQDRVTTAYTTAQSSYGFDSTKVNLFAASGGAAPILNWAIANVAKVQSITLVIPAVDIRDIDLNNRVSVLGFDPVTQGPRAAYGGSTPGTAFNPVSNAAALAGIPIRLYYSNTDNVCLPATQTAFQTAVGSSCTLVNMGNLGHGASFNPFEVLQFLTANG